MELHSHAMSATSDPVGTLQVALAHTERLLESDPSLAVAQATEILKVIPGQPVATLLLGIAHRMSGDASRAADILASLAAKRSDWAAVHYELGLALGAARRGDEAVRALRR